jgi:hypothetical protein
MGFYSCSECQSFGSDLFDWFVSSHEHWRNESWILQNKSKIHYVRLCQHSWVHQTNTKLSDRFVLWFTCSRWTDASPSHVSASRWRTYQLCTRHAWDKSQEVHVRDTDQSSKCENVQYFCDLFNDVRVDSVQPMIDPRMIIWDICWFCCYCSTYF